MEWLTSPLISAFFDWVLKTTLLASVIIILILIIKAVLNNKVKPGWHYALWLVLMLRLLLPFGPQSEFSIENLFFKIHAAQPSEVKSPIHLTGNETIPSASTPEGRVVVHPEKETSEAITSVGRAWSVKQVLTGIWLFVAMALLLYFLLVNIHFSIKLLQFAEPAASSDIQVLIQSKQIMGIRRRIRLSFSTVVTTPTLFGLFRPHLILPVNSRELQKERLHHIYLHELSHVRHADIFVNWLMHLLLILHWFNPLIWYAIYKMREDQELSADALALSRIDPKQVSEYGHTIITMLERYKRFKQIPGTAGLSGSKKQLKRRILMIKYFKRKSFSWTLIGMTLMVVLSGCALTNGKTAMDKNVSKLRVDTTTTDKNVSKPHVDTTTTAKNSTPTTADKNSGDTPSGDAVMGNDAKDGSATNTESGSGNVPTSSKGSDNQRGAVTIGSNQPTAQASSTRGHEQQINNIVALAKNGMVKGANFVAGKTTIDDIYATWGKPSRHWQPNDPYAYDTYSLGVGSGTYAFGIGQGDVVYDLRYFGSMSDKSQAFNQINFVEIKKSLGRPSSVKINSGDDILIYNLGDYELKFVGPHKTQRLDHISVYSQRGAKSTMAG